MSYHNSRAGWTYLYRRDNGRFFAVVDLEDWRESSRITQGFSEKKTEEFAWRKLNKEEAEDYSKFMRLYSASYPTLEALIADEERLEGKEFASALRAKFKEKFKFTEKP